MFLPINSAYKTISILGDTIQLTTKEEKLERKRKIITKSLLQQRESRVLFNTYPEAWEQHNHFSSLIQYIPFENKCITALGWEDKNDQIISERRSQSLEILDPLDKTNLGSRLQRAPRREVEELMEQPRWRAQLTLNSFSMLASLANSLLSSRAVSTGSSLDKDR